jgi:hypothetical protein
MAVNENILYLHLYYYDMKKSLYLPQKSFLTYSFSNKATIPKKIKPTIKVIVGLRISAVISQIARWSKTTARNLNVTAHICGPTLQKPF